MRISSRSIAILQALFVTFLWSTSWVLIKRTLQDIPPLTFAGLRYTLAFLILLPGLIKHRAEIHGLTSRDWKRLTALGLVFYTLTQGGQFITLYYLEAVSFSLLLNFTTLFVAFFGIIALKEIPTRLQWWGIVIFLMGVFFYFAPTTHPGGEWLGYVLASITVLANAVAVILGRSVNREAKISPIVVTTISMGIGALFLVIIGLLIEGVPTIRTAVWAAILWLALVNTAFAFVLWNKTLRILSAIESSIINNTMLIQIAILAYFILDEQLNAYNIVGLVLAVVGIFFVNWRPRISN